MPRRRGFVSARQRKLVMAKPKKRKRTVIVKISKLTCPRGHPVYPTGHKRVPATAYLRGGTHGIDAKKTWRYELAYRCDTCKKTYVKSQLIATA